MVPVKHNELADASCLSRSSAALILKDLVDRGMIRTDYGSITILDGKALESELSERTALSRPGPADFSGAPRTAKGERADIGTACGEGPFTAHHVECCAQTGGPRRARRRYLTRSLR
ncbi:helix-turn-helix domain-containing protein [Palleronia sp. KMU-117]|uniref:helix-turn-helix domain-containing protein n=1 Tax=Palleronia sp. KMU-117 TaxID=3434108 RepID=UPI003D7477A6